MNKHQLNAFNVIKRKLNSEAIESENMEVMYNFLMYKNKKDWNFRNCFLSGFGECLRSNNDLTDEEIERFKDFWSSYNIIIIKNKVTNEYNCLLLPPAVEYEEPTNQNIITNPLAPLDVIQQKGKSENWIVSNEFDDEVELKPYTFDKDIEMENVMSENLLTFNDLLCDYLSNNEYPLFSTVLTETQNLINAQKYQKMKDENQFKK